MTVEGNRKVIGAIVTVVIGVVVTQVKGDIPPNLLSLLIAVFSGFVLGNVGEHISGAIAGRVMGAPSTSAPEEPSVSGDIAILDAVNHGAGQIQALNEKMDTVVAGVDLTNKAMGTIFEKYKING